MRPITDRRLKQFRESKYRFSILTALAIFMFLPYRSTCAQTPAASTPFLRITPSTVVVEIGETAQFNAVDSAGRPVAGAIWSLDDPIATVSSSGESVGIQSKRAGQTILRVSLGNLSATAVVSVIRTERIPSTVLWSVDPWPGYESLFIRQAAAVAEGPDFFDVEWSRTSPAIVRALKRDGRQIWMAQLDSMASPETLKRKTLPPLGQTVRENGQRVDVDQLLLLEGDSVAALKNSRQTKSRNFPSEGVRIFVHDCGDGFGGLVFLERGSAADSLVDLGSAGTEVWRYKSAGRLTDSWTVNYEGDIGIVETLSDPLGSSLLIINGKTGEVRVRVPFPNSSTRITGLKCISGTSLANIRPSQAGAPFTSVDGNIYLQIAVHNESKQGQCPNTNYSFENTLYLLQVTPSGESNWRVITQIHSDAVGGFKAQARVFAGESIPDGFGGVLAAWTYASPGNAEGEQPHFEARLSRMNLSDSSQQYDFALPFPGWSTDPSFLFDENMVLGDGNSLYATDGHSLLRFDVSTGEVKWVVGTPRGKVKLHFATAGGGVLVEDAGELGRIDSEGHGQRVPWSVDIPDFPEDIGLVQFDLYDHTPASPIALRSTQLLSSGTFLGVEDGSSHGGGGVIEFISSASGPPAQH